MQVVEKPGVGIELNLFRQLLKEEVRSDPISAYSKILDNVAKKIDGIDTGKLSKTDAGYVETIKSNLSAIDREKKISEEKTKFDAIFGALSSLAGAPAQEKAAPTEKKPTTQTQKAEKKTLGPYFTKEEIEAARKSGETKIEPKKEEKPAEKKPAEKPKEEKSKAKEKEKAKESETSAKKAALDDKTSAFFDLLMEKDHKQTAYDLVWNVAIKKSAGVSEEMIREDRTKYLFVDSHKLAERLAKQHEITDEVKITEMTILIYHLGYPTARKAIEKAVGKAKEDGREVDLLNDTPESVGNVTMKYAKKNLEEFREKAGIKFEKKEEKKKEEAKKEEKKTEEKKPEEKTKEEPKKEEKKEEKKPEGKVEGIGIAFDAESFKLGGAEGGKTTLTGTVKVDGATSLALYIADEKVPPNFGTYTVDVVFVPGNEKGRFSVDVDGRIKGSCSVEGGVHKGNDIISPIKATVIIGEAGAGKKVATEKASVQAQAIAVEKSAPKTEVSEVAKEVPEEFASLTGKNVKDITKTEAVAAINKFNGYSDEEREKLAELLSGNDATKRLLAACILKSVEIANVSAEYIYVPERITIQTTQSQLDEYNRHRNEIKNKLDAVKDSNEVGPDDLTVKVGNGTVSLIDIYAIHDKIEKLVPPYSK